VPVRGIRPVPQPRRPCPVGPRRNLPHRVPESRQNLGLHPRPRHPTSWPEHAWPSKGLAWPSKGLAWPGLASQRPLGIRPLRPLGIRRRRPRVLRRHRRVHRRRRVHHRPLLGRRRGQPQGSESTGRSLQQSRRCDYAWRPLSGIRSNPRILHPQTMGHDRSGHSPHIQPPSSCSSKLSPVLCEPFGESDRIPVPARVHDNFIISREILLSQGKSRKTSWFFLDYPIQTSSSLGTSPDWLMGQDRWRRLIWGRVGTAHHPQVVTSQQIRWWAVPTLRGSMSRSPLSPHEPRFSGVQENMLIQADFP
jgi:hypothetical protein